MRTTIQSKAASSQSTEPFFFSADIWMKEKRDALAFEQGVV